jgi:hypothetical protein
MLVIQRPTLDAQPVPTYVPKIKYGFGESLEKFSSKLPFVIDYSAVTKHSHLTESLDITIEYCREIASHTPLPIALMLSGGVDSQAMAYAFHRSGIKTRNVMASYPSRINIHDMDRTFYDRNGISIEVMDVDIVDFHEREIFDWAKIYGISSPHILSHCKIASILKNYFVVSSGCIMGHPKIGGSGKMNYSVFGLTRFSEISGQKMIGYFFNQNPHLVYSTLSTDIDIEFDEAMDVYDAKCRLYHASGFPVIPQTEKTHGFEKLKNYYDSHTVPIATRLRYATEDSNRSYDLLFRYPLETIAPYSLRHLTKYPTEFC